VFLFANEEEKERERQERRLYEELAKKEQFGQQEDEREGKEALGEHEQQALKSGDRNLNIRKDFKKSKDVSQEDDEEEEEEIVFILRCEICR
jgi:hypothetical protein